MHFNIDKYNILECKVSTYIKLIIILRLKRKKCQKEKLQNQFKI